MLQHRQLIQLNNARQSNSEMYHLKTMLRSSTQGHYQLIIHAFFRLHNKRKNALSSKFFAWY